MPVPAYLSKLQTPRPLAGSTSMASMLDDMLSQEEQKWKGEKQSLDNKWAMDAAKLEGQRLVQQERHQARLAEADDLLHQTEAVLSGNTHAWTARVDDKRESRERAHEDYLDEVDRDREGRDGVAERLRLEDQERKAKTEEERFDLAKKHIQERMKHDRNMLFAGDHAQAMEDHAAARQALEAAHDTDRQQSDEQRQIILDTAEKNNKARHVKCRH